VRPCGAGAAAMNTAFPAWRAVFFFAVAAGMGIYIGKL
jgi:hypothetical protein